MARILFFRFFVIAIGVGAIQMTGCVWQNAARSNPYGNYPSPYYGGNSSGYDNYRYRNRDYYWEQRERERLQHEREKLESDREKLNAERRRLTQEKRRQKLKPRHAKPLLPPPAVKPTPSTKCPSGFRPSEKKCTKKERKHGCKDLRLPNGVGCVMR